MKRLIPFLALVMCAGCGGDDNNNPTAPTGTPPPYSQTDLVVGTGVAAISGNQVTVAYTGWLYDAARPEGKGTQFETNAGFSFRLGTGSVIRGWDQGVPGMRVGGQRRLVLPPDLAYGNRSPDPTRIPNNATLVFDITLNAVQ
jgi:FKBP-type peptidyl-prolyl cis-trans isomerase FkpA